MKKTIFSKIFGGYLFLLILLTLLITAFSFSIIKAHLINTLTTRLEHIGKALSGQLEPEITEDSSREPLQNLVRKKGEELGTRITVILPSGVVIADSEEAPEQMGNHRERPEVLEALSGRTGSSLRYSTTVREQMLYVGIPLKKDGETIAVLRTSLFLRDINNLIGRVRTRIIIAGAVGIIISLIAAYALSRNLAKPIRELAAGADEIAQGNFLINISIPNRDELQQLARAFNEMAEKIKVLFSDLTLQKEELTGILSSMHEGLLVVDRNGKAVMGNESFTSIIDEKEFKGRHFTEMIPGNAFSSLISRIRETKKNQTAEVSISSAEFLCSAAYVELSEETVVIFHDITKQKQLERMKKDFVVNVSHELRTPLTAIKGYIETLADEVKDGLSEYVEIIQKNTDRLVNIVEDLLTLSELEEAGLKLDRETFDISSVIGNVIQVFRNKASEKGLELSAEISPDLPRLTADPFKIEQMLINLVENAIRYTENGSVTVSAQPGESGAGIILKVTDTGYGIPAEYSNQIFERFFVIDKSRSRKLGGTGLGLSIVKHIVMLHGGAIALESTPGSGTTFFITLPVGKI